MSASVTNIMERPIREVMIRIDIVPTFEQMEGESIHKSLFRFEGLITQCPNHALPDMMLTNCFYRGLSPGKKRLLNSLILGFLDKQPYAAAAQLLNKIKTVMKNRRNTQKT